MVVSLKAFVEPSRLNEILSQLETRMPQYNRDQLLLAMDEQFLDLFLSGAFGDAMMVTAGYQYLKMLEAGIRKPA